MTTHLGKWSRRSALGALAALAALAPAACINIDRGEKAKPVVINTGRASNAGGDSKAGSGDWKDTLIDIVGGRTLAGRSGVLFYAFDSLAHPGKPVDLFVQIKKLKGFSGVAGLTVEFKLDGKSLGSAVTDDDGYAKLAWTPPEARDYDIAAAITASKRDEFEPLTKLPATRLLVAARAKDAKFVVIDLDHTVVASSFFRVLVGGARPMPNAAKVVKEIRARYSIVYLTHRPDLMTLTSKGWLKNNGFVRAPLLVSTLKEAFGDSGKFKTGKLKALRKSFPNVAIGIGDKLSDSQAYVDNGLKSYLIPHYDHDDAEDCRDMARDIRKLSGKVQVVDTWRQVRDGIFKGKTFPATAYADRLDARAKRLEDKKRKDDDDDDDDD